MSNFSSVRQPLALIAGPTASGKSGLAMRLAERVGGAIVNADSAQVYRDLRIVTARPSPAEEARIPHCLYGYRDGAEPCSAADWAKDARGAIEEARSAGRVPILAGGTGLYVRTLLEGIAPVPPIDAAIRAQVRALPVPEAREALEHEDPAAAGRLGRADSARIARALEVVRSTGRPIAEWQQQRTGGIAGDVDLVPIVLLPPREWLSRRCDERFEAMLSDPGIEEVRALLARGLPPSAPVMRAIGVREIAAWIEGRLDREQALEAGRGATRRYAKRQYTWLRHQADLSWPRFEAPLDQASIEDAVEILLQSPGLQTRS